MEKTLRGHVTMSEAANAKTVTLTALHYAIQRGEFDFVDLGNRRLIVDNFKYRAWKPNTEFQRMARHEPRKPRRKKETNNV